MAITKEQAESLKAQSEKQEQQDQLLREILRRIENLDADDLKVCSLFPSDRTRWKRISSSLGRT